MLRISLDDANHYIYYLPAITLQDRCKSMTLDMAM